MSLDDLQFYPTPATLAAQAWAKFDNRQFVRVLESSAGDGALAQAGTATPEYVFHRFPIDCCEIDIRHHALLREQGYAVVGLDFMEFAAGAHYSHIICNPPFRYGAEHVVKAWDILWDGEIVAILNAETLRNPFSPARRHLLRLVQSHGDLEYLSGAFSCDDAERKCDVEIVLVHLTKRADLQSDVYGDLIGELRKEQGSGPQGPGSMDLNQSVALPASEIENAVLAFDAAVESMRQAVLAENRAAFYARLLGDTFAARCGGMQDTTSVLEPGGIQAELHKRYALLKDRAWAGILRSTNVTSRLSSNAQRRLEREFKEITELCFTAPNIYGFLCGLVQNQGEMLAGMFSDVFDLISKYHSDNTVFFKGWVSNNRHRTCGMKLKATRFILPGHGTESYHRSFDWDSEQLLRDLDKIFAALDGKPAPDLALVDVCRSAFHELRRGKRISASYFDIRHYPGAGTLHFFPRRPDLIDRLNRWVGKRRAWLPDENAPGTARFWAYYEQADKYDAEIRAEVSRRAGRAFARHPFHMLNGNEEQKRLEAGRAIDDAAAAVLEKHGVEIGNAITDNGPPLALAAA